MKDKQLEKILEDIIKKRTKEGYSTASLLNYIKKRYKVKDTRAYQLISLAKSRVGEFYYNTSESVLEDALERLESMYQTALEDDDNKLALQIQQELNKLLQLHIQKIELSGTIAIEQPLFSDLKDEDGNIDE